MERWSIVNAAVVSGDGRMLYPAAAVHISGSRVEGLEERRLDLQEMDALARHRRVIDGQGLMVWPGIINHHAHGAVPGPLFPSGEPPLPVEQVRANLDRHLREGVTTLVNVCGFCLPEEAAAVADHPVRILLTTAHLEAARQAALALGGRGLQERHRQATVEEMLAQGAAAVGEIGAGHTLGGRGQDYGYIPKAIAAATGRMIDPNQARALKLATLGRRADPGAFDREATARVLAQIGLDAVLSPQQARDIVAGCVLPPMATALAAFDAAAELAARFRVPAIFHNSAPSAERLLAVARRYAEKGARIIAAHSNHDTFTAEECAAYAQRLRDAGAVIDAATFSLTAEAREKMGDFRDRFDALAAAGCIDLISTDYNGGWWVGIPAAIARLVQHGWASVPKAVAMATANVADVLGLTDRGRIRAGLLADLTIVYGHDLSHVAAVVVGGKVVCGERELAPRAITRHP
ncbi:MAG TPA: amidohydrolase family protein [Limnochordales bacterium]|nr:amidohydrolase family protein [Limnochordales bacterium]